MKGYHEEWTDQLSDYIDDALAPVARGRLEAHLAECVRCRDVLDELREVVALAKGAEVLDPPADLWPAVAASIPTGEAAGAVGGDDVIALPTARVRPVPVAGSGLRLGLAAAALVLVSVGSTWWVATAGAAGPTAGTLPEGTSSGVLMPAAGAIPQDLAAQLGALEGLVEARRATLDPATVELLERNLRTIQNAIDDSAEALAADPGNAFLMEHLERMYRRKLTYLQDAVRVAEWTG